MCITTKQMDMFMEIFDHNLHQLFEQMGLSSDPDSIQQFLTNHKLSKHEDIHQADFWNESQKAFLQEARSQDADWVEQVDLLDCLLRKD